MDQCDNLALGDRLALRCRDGDDLPAGVATFRAKVAGPHAFSRMRKVRLMPRYDAIRLGFGLTIYIPADDYDMVKEFILARLPENADVR